MRAVAIVPVTAIPAPIFAKAESSFLPFRFSYSGLEVGPNSLAQSPVLGEVAELISG
jgi:hypothetical protein